MTSLIPIVLTSNRAKPKTALLELRRHNVRFSIPFSQRKQVENLLVGALRYFRVMHTRRQKHFLQSQSNIWAANSLPCGRQNDLLLRDHIFSALFRAWMIRINQHPRIKNKIYQATKFIIFSNYILQRLGIGKSEDLLYNFYLAESDG